MSPFCSLLLRNCSLPELPAVSSNAVKTSNSLHSALNLSLQLIVQFQLPSGHFPSTTHQNRRFTVLKSDLPVFISIVDSTHLLSPPTSERSLRLTTFSPGRSVGCSFLPHFNFRFHLSSALFHLTPHCTCFQLTFLPLHSPFQSTIHHRSPPLGENSPCGPHFPAPSEVSEHRHLHQFKNLYIRRHSKAVKLKKISLS